MLLSRNPKSPDDVAEEVLLGAVAAILLIFLLSGGCGL